MINNISNSATFTGAGHQRNSVSFKNSTSFVRNFLKAPLESQVVFLENILNGDGHTGLVKLLCHDDFLKTIVEQKNIPILTKLVELLKRPNRDKPLYPNTNQGLKSKIETETLNREIMELLKDRIKKIQSFKKETKKHSTSGLKEQPSHIQSAAIALLHMKHFGTLS